MQPSPRAVVEAVIELNFLENELAALGPRSQKRENLAAAIQSQRVHVPPTVIGHHDRLRARGKSSVVAVVDWVCRGCFISIPIGLRTHLARLEDIHVCENCGSYQYIPDGALGQKLIEQARRKAELASRPAPAKPKAKVGKTPAPKAKAASKKKAAPAAARKSKSKTLISARNRRPRRVLA